MKLRMWGKNQSTSMALGLHVVREGESPLKQTELNLHNDRCAAGWHRGMRRFVWIAQKNRQSLQRNGQNGQRLASETTRSVAARR